MASLRSPSLKFGQTGRFALPLLGGRENQGAVVAPEAEGVREDGGEGAGLSLGCDELDGALGVGLRAVDGGRKFLVAQGFDAKDRAERGCGAETMAGDGLGGTARHAVFAK